MAESDAKVTAFIARAINALEREYAYYMGSLAGNWTGSFGNSLPKGHPSFVMQAKHAAVINVSHSFPPLSAACMSEPNPTFILNRYAQRTALARPRPESYWEDVNTALNGTGYGPESQEALALWANIAAGAETGWDYSSRWVGVEPEGGQMKDIFTDHVIPVDLNAILYKSEMALARLHARAAS